MNEARVYADGFERSFAEVKDLLEFLAERGRNAKWIRKPTNTLRLAPLEKEAQNLDAADASMEEILEDTEKNTQLVLKMRGESYPVRDCAIRTILSRAGVNGDGLRKLDKATYAKVVNYCLRVAKGDALIKIADGKVSAVHGGDKHDYCMPAFIMGGNVMGTALVMEHANALAQMIVSEKDKLFDERVEALVKLYRRAEFYLKQGFLESIVCEFHRKKVEMIMQAETKGEITEILKLSKPHFDGKKFVYTSPYAVEEEELLLWSLTSLQGPLRDEGYRRYRELFEKCLPEMAEKIPA